MCDVHQTPIQTAGEMPMFRVPSRCMVVRGGGRLDNESSEFDPCDWGKGFGRDPLDVYSLGDGGALPACVNGSQGGMCQWHPWAVEQNCSESEELPPCRPPFPANCVAQLHSVHPVTCATLAQAQLCPYRMEELYGDQTPQALPPHIQAPDVLALHCRLECTPGLCMNSEESEARVQELLAKFPKRKAESEKPDEERAALHRLREEDKAKANGTWVPDPSRPTTQQVKEQTCRREVRRHQGALSTSHGVSDYERGRDWCPTVVLSETTKRREAVARICDRKPRWGDSAEGITQAVAKTLEPDELVVGFVLQLLFGLHGIFSYGALTLAGLAIGVQLRRDGFVSAALVRVGTLLSVLCFVVGLGISVHLRKNRSDVPDVPAEPTTDAFLRSASRR